jgi:peptidoglycan-N-acetylglucosamine deacetylase
VYLTFDDGPSAEATPFVLDVLKTHEVKATFFVLGKNAQANPSVLARLKEEGHLVANHGMEHLNGWKTSTQAYVKNTVDGRVLSASNMFRPPYGKLKFRQYLRLRHEHKVVFWDVISGDFDQNVSPKQVIRNVVENSRKGSIIVMHDSIKAMKNMEGSLNGIIMELKAKGFHFEVLNNPN